ncbi:MAG: hypothetical protein K8U57_13000 [Planctomycetes bacterium]|nr:hypothetical protein [Planctomycetota bacterium]
MPRWLLLLASVALAVVVGSAAGEVPSVGTPGQAVAGPSALVHPDGLPVEDPFPIRRLRATEAQLSEAQKQLEAGAIVRLPLSEFEARVRAASRVATEARQTPRITDARFKAALVGGDLVGSAELEIVNTGSKSRFFPLDPLRLALGIATWGEGREAIVGVPSGGTIPAVWLDRPGRQTLKFGWSATGVTEPGERRFDLRVPTAPTAVLELELPVGQVPTVSATEVLLTGPFPLAGNPPRAEWRARFGGRSRLDIAVHPAGNPGVPAAATLAAKYDITPGQISCGFEYDLRPASGTVGEWAFNIDPGLRIADVVMNNRAGWTVDPPAGPNLPRRLRVTLRQPGAGGKILISAVAPFPDQSRPHDSPLPGVRPIGAVLDDETLDIRIAPGLNIENWNPGDYRLTDTQTLPDQTRTLALTGTLLPPGTDRPFRRLPMLVPSEIDREFTTTEYVAWRFDTDRVMASVRVALRVRRGPLFAFALTVPPGYALSRVTSAPDELVSYSGTNANTVVVELARPLTTGQSADLIFEFRGPPLSSGPHRLPFPAFTPVGASERVGVLGVYPGSVWTTSFQTGAGITRCGWFDPFGPLAPGGVSASFRFNGSDPDGWAQLTPAKPVFFVESATRTETLAGRQLEATTFAIDIKAGALPALLAMEPNGAFVDRKWQVVGGGNAVSSAGLVPVMAILRRCIGIVNLCPVRFWVVGFARPATGEITLEAVTTRLGDADTTFPRLAIAGAMRYRTVSLPDVKLTLPMDPIQPWGFSGVYLVTVARSQSDIVVFFGGSVTTSNGTVLPITLPSGAEVRAAAVGGKWMTPGSLRMSSDGVLNLPLPAQMPVRFEVRYRLAIEATGPVISVRSPEPKLPGEVEVKRWWAFSTGVLAGWPVHPWDRGTVAELPAMLGDVPLLGAGVVVSRSPVEAMRIATAGTADAVGVGIAAVLLAFGWAGGRRRHPFCGFLLVTALFAVAVVGQLGPPWWQRAAISPLIVGLVVAGGMVIVRGHRSRLPAVAALIVFVCVLSEPESAAQQPAPTTVLLLSPDRTGQETVVVPKPVLDRLAAIRPTTPGVVLTAAEYAATADDTTARVTAKFTAHAISGQEPAATLTLSDARLERVTVDGTAAFPVTLRSGVYSVPLPGIGRHEIEARFAVAVTGTGPEREIRFGVPDVPATKVTADLPGSAKQAQVVGRMGRQTVTPGQRVRLDADVGAVKAFQVRWRDGAAGTANVKVREGCIWDVSEDGADLTASYLVRVEQGTVSTLRFDVPTELEPLALAIRPLDSGGTVALRDWSIGADQAGFRPLRLDLQEPTGGRMLVVLSLSPRKSITRQPVLRFPKVVLPGTPSTELDAAYGLRAKGVVVEELARGGVIDFSPDALTREFAGVAELRLDPNTPVRVFRPTIRSGAELRPTLRVNTEPPAFTIDTNWHLGASRGTATGTVRWTGKEPQSFVEFGLPGVKMLEIRGPDIAGWAQPDGRVQLWLKKAAKDGEFAWTGTVNTPASPFEAITPRLVNGRLISDSVRVRPAEGFSLTLERDRGWTHTATTGDHFSYRTSNAAFPPIRVALSPTNRTLQPDELGWLSPLSRSNPTPEEPLPTNRKPVATNPTRPTTSASSQEFAPQWVWPVSAAVGWGASVLLLLMLMARFSRSTWPEQFGLIGGLFGIAIGYGWWVGLALWFAARAFWLFEITVRGSLRRV